MQCSVGIGTRETHTDLSVGRWGYIRIHQNTSEYIKIHRDTSGYIGIHRDTSGYIRIHQDTSGYIRIHQNKSRSFCWIYKNGNTPVPQWNWASSGWTGGLYSWLTGEVFKGKGLKVAK